MADEQQLALIKQGIRVWNEWRDANPSTKVDLTGVDPTSADLNLEGANLEGANLSGAKLSGANLRDANLRDAGLTAAHLIGAYLGGANLSGANLREASLRDANLRDANLTAAHLIGAHLSGANLVSAYIVDANLVGANLSGACLIDAYLTHAQLIETNLTDADLSNAYLWDANLRDADLAGANLTRANLTRANLTHAGLAGADLTGAHCRETILVDLDLSQALGLDAISHEGPSTVDHRTLERSGRLPLSFLRGCGLPDRLIDYLPSLRNAAPIEFYSVFISYSTANQAFAERLHADLQARGVRCWFAPHDMQGGKKIHDQIDAAIRVYDRLLVILSSESMSSRWVKTEIEKAREKEVSSNRDVLFPVALVPFTEIREWRQFNPDLGEDTARTIREYYVPDFSGWESDHGRYLESFEKLLASLNSADTRSGSGRTAGRMNDSLDATGEAG